MTQLDLFGGEIDIKDIPKPSKKTKTMQEMFGIIKNKQCRTCKHLEQHRQANRWYKCEIWNSFFRGSSQASDIRLKNQACGMYEEEE